MAFEVKNLSFSYNNIKALSNISFNVPGGSFTSIIGPTGSGKTTLAKILSGILKDKGNAVNPKPELGKTSFVFQYPETQLFEQTVLKDAMFGLLNKNLSYEEAELKAEKYLKEMGIGKELFDKDPFEISGGEKRKVALAGMLALENKVLVLDEPGSGLDPVSREDILDKIYKTAKENNTTVFMITHNMDEVVKYSDFVIELNRGKLENFGKTRDVMKVSSMVPDITKICYSMGIKETVLSLDEALTLMKDIHQ